MLLYRDRKRRYYVCNKRKIQFVSEIVIVFFKTRGKGVVLLSYVTFSIVATRSMKFII
jgi:hypothetical protein